MLIWFVCKFANQVINTSSLDKNICVRIKKKKRYNHLLDKVNNLLFCGVGHQPFIQVGDDVSADLAGQLVPEIRFSTLISLSKNKTNYP